jgi:DNA-binding Lrp family transcriptional regulator
LYKKIKLPTQDSFFFADREIFGKLIPRQIMIYLFICKSFSVQLNNSWNSYNDIARQTGMKRETVIETVAELEELRYIRRSRRKARDNRRVYVDNHYFLIVYVKGRIHKKQGKKLARLYCEYNRTGVMPYKSIYYINSYPNTEKRFCQEVSKNFFASRGSP